MLKVNYLPRIAIYTRTILIRGLPGGLGGKGSACSAGDLSLIPRSGDPLEKGMATHSSQYHCLENHIDKEVWWVTVHGVVKSWT